MERNDRDEYRGGSHTSDRRRSIPDIRSNNNAFSSNRDTFREPMNRESTRDFPPRDPPRGPKGLIDAPTGPRASGYSSDFRGDRGDYGYRGDYRGDRGRGRARGWRDDSRDRVRDLDRNYRRDRDDRGPPHFRDEPGRERWGRESYNRGRRSSPQGRGRSPTYGPRDTRDAPPSIEIDRARRGSRDGPLSGGSPSSDSVGFSRGFGRAPRGGRGRGRGYYDDHRRSRSPEPGWSRRTQPSATPPPQVPAFGSNMLVSGPVPGVAVPTAPRSQRGFGHGNSRAPTSLKLMADNSKKDEQVNTSQPSRQSPSVHTNKDHQHAAALNLRDGGKEPGTISAEKSSVPTVQTDRKRKPVIGKRLPKHNIQDISDIEDSGDDLDDSYFEEEIAKAQQQIEQVPKDNPLMPREDPEAPFLKPFIDANIDELPSTTKLLAPEPCVAPKVIHEAPVPESEVSSNILTAETSAPRTLAPEPRSKGKSRSATPLPEPQLSAKSRAQKEAAIPALETSSSLGSKRGSRKEAIIPPFDPSAFLQGPSPSSAANSDFRKEAVIPPWDPSAFLQEPSREPVRKSSGISDVTAFLAGSSSRRGSRQEPDTPMPDATGFLQGASQEPSRKSSSGISDVAAFLAGSSSRRGSLQETDTPMADATASSQGPGPNQVPPKRAFPGFSDLDAFLSAPSRSEKAKSYTRRETATASRDTDTSRGEDPAGGEKPIAAPKPRKPMMETFEDTGDLTDAEDAEILERVRPFMKTPPLDSLPKFNCKKPFEDEDLMKEMADMWDNHELNARIRQNIIEKKERDKREQDEERERYKERLLAYRRRMEFSMDEVAVKSREKFAKSRAKAAAEAAALQASSLPSNGGKPEGQRRTGSRWATEHDIERVLRESEQEAKDSKEREERAARAKTASAKEATIPDMCWSEELWNETRFHDKTHLVPFERSFARLEYGEPIDNFTEEECRIFEEVYLEFPKQWSKIAEALPDRDYKACIQHYYLVKHDSNLKEKLRKQPKKKKGRKAASKNPKSNALMADLGLTIRDETEEGQDAENGERRRPRRAAAPTWPIETPASESEVASPAPTPSRKTAAAPKGDANNDAPPSKRKTKAAREKGSKQTKNNQLLAAAPTALANRQPESPAPPMPPAEWKNQREPSVNPRVPQFDGPAQKQSTFTSAFAPVEKPSPATPTSFESKSQPVYAQQERLESAPPMGFEQPQDRRTIQQTSSYWSVPEQTDFPALLKHFGTDWHGIAKYMTSKTHIMVYTNLFKTWLAVPSDSNKSRLVANIQTQVKNYYQRQVDSGKMKEWEDFTREADARKERGEIPPDLPPPTMMPKRRYDITPGTLPRSGSSMDLSDDLAPANQSKILTQASPPQPSLSARFPALAQAGPVPQIQPATPTTVLNKHLPPQPIQQAAQQVQQTSRPPRGPALGYFTQSEPRESRDPRPIMQANTPLSERSLMAAQEAHAEQRRAESIRLKHEQSEQQQQAAMQRELMQQQALQQQALQQQALQRERQSQMKQESEAPDLRQFEAYPAPQHSGNIAQSRPELPKATPPAPTEQRRTTAPPHQFQPRTHQPARNFLGESIAGMREIKSTPSPAGPRPPMSAPPTTQEQYSAPPPSMLQHPPPQHHPHMSQAPPQPTPAPPQAAPPQAVAPVRPQETVRKTSSIMSLLNDEPSDPRPTPTKRVSDVSSSALQPSRTPPPPQHSLQGSRYVAHPSQAGPQATQMPQQLSTQPPVQQQTQLPPSQLSYGQPNPHPLHQHTSSIGHSRSYTPTGFDRGGYSQAPIQQQQQPPAQQLYSQPPPRSTMTSQPPPIRRESSMGEIHGVTSGYASRTSAPSQSRLKESPYSQPTPPPQTQALRQPAGSPLDLAPSSDRDYYQRQAPYLMQQQQSATSSPQPGPYHPQSIQQPQPSHRQFAFGQGPTHVASPPPQYAGPHTLHRSRHNSFDGRFQMTTSAPGPVPQGYAQAPQHQPTPPAGLQMQYQQQHPNHDRYESSYERERRIQEEVYQRRVEEQRRMDDARR
ncbi:hypothetical protein EG329_010871 [Mollisiaceae sp. DMI_Dod_QoI]|nr:hypothetical protein EG329_010871 [Helotiales sp. DMI_Dod_QoI]